MNMKERLRANKQTNTDLILLLIIIITMTVFNIVFTSVLGTVAIITILFNAIATGAVVVVLERKGGSFASHFVLFSLMLSNYPRALFTLFSFQSIDISQIFGMLFSIYVLYKMYIHFDELTGYFRKPSREIIYIGTFALLQVYNNGFPELILYLVLMASIASSMNEKEVLPLAIYVFAMSMFRQIMAAVLISFAGNFGSYLILILNVLINTILIYYSLKIYFRSNDNDTEVDERLQYYS